MKDRARLLWSRRALAIGVAGVLMIGACSPSADVTPGPTGGAPSSNAPNTTGQPTESQGPATTLRPGESAAASTPNPDLTPYPVGSPDPEIPDEPLPPPKWTQASEINAYIGSSGHAGLEAAVSLCRYLGIGIHAADGSVILEGSDTKPDDFYLFEDEVRELPVMAVGDYLDPEITWSQFHDSLASFGVEMSAQELFDAYSEAYQEPPFTPMGDLMSYLMPYDMEQPMTRLDAWLLFLDGFVPPNGSGASGSTETSQLAYAGAGDIPLGGRFADGNPLAQWGLAQFLNTHLITLPYTSEAKDFPQLIAHLMVLAGQVKLRVVPRSSRIHEGHGTTGAPQQFKVTVTAPGATDWVGSTGAWLRPGQNFAGKLDGLQVTWQTVGPWADHGSFSPGLDASNNITSTLGADNSSAITYTPRQELANGQGKVVSEGAVMWVKVNASDIVEKMYGAPPGSLRGLLGRADAETLVSAKLEKHDIKTLHIKFVDDFDAGLDLLPIEGHPQLMGITEKGADIFEGDLTQTEDGNWRGVVNGSANQTEHISIFGDPCTTSFVGTQQVQVIGTSGSYREGNFLLTFLPISPPQYTSPPTCYPEKRVATNGIEWLQYYSSDYNDHGWVVNLPPAPGGTWTKTWPTDAPQGSHLKRTATLTVEYHVP